MPKGLVPFLKQAEIHNLVKQLAHQVKRDYVDQAVTLICPLRGSVFFLSDFVRQLSGSVEVDFVFIESSSDGNFKIKKDIALDLKSRHVIIVDEIIDSGLSISFLKKRIELCQPASCKILVLFDKPSHRKVFVGINYVGQVVDNRFMVGYGMDMDEEGRGLADVYHLEQ